MGSKLGEMATGGYTMIDIPVPGQTIVHVHAGAEELNRVYSATLAINASNAAFAAALAAMGPVQGKGSRAATVKQARAEYEAWQKPGTSPGPEIGRASCRERVCQYV